MLDEKSFQAIATRQNERVFSRPREWGTRMFLLVCVFYKPGCHEIWICMPFLLASGEYWGLALFP